MLYHEEPHEIDTREVRIAETIGAHVGFAIEQHRARMEQELAAEVHKGQFHALELLVSGTPLEDVLAGLASIVNEASGGTAAASILLVDEAGRMHNGASPGLPKWYLDEIDGLEISPTAGTCLAAAARSIRAACSIAAAPGPAPGAGGCSAGTDPVVGLVRIGWWGAISVATTGFLPVDGGDRRLRRRRTGQPGRSRLRLR